MQDVEDLISRLVEISEVRTAGGWKGWVAVREGGKDRFSRTEWQTLLEKPEALLDNAQDVIKSSGRNAVVIKYLATGGRGVKAVIKRHSRGRGVLEFLRSLGAPRAMRNFIAAVKIRQYGLRVAVPLAAIYRQRFLFCEESIYISEYVEGVHLHKFLKDLPGDSKERHRIMSRLTEQMAEILAGLHERGLWHRDAKATNFIVTGDGVDNYRLVLTDLDGIKQYSIRRKTCQMRPLWQLAASVMELPGISRTDYMRTFKAYCERAANPPEQRGELFRELAAKARAKFKRKSQGQNGR